MAGLRLDEVSIAVEKTTLAMQEQENRLVEELIRKYEVDRHQLDRLIALVTEQATSVALEMYAEGFLDGGKVASMFFERKIPLEGVDGQ